MRAYIDGLNNLLRSPLSPLWVVVALLPFGRSAELGTLLCLLACLWIWHHRGVTLWSWAGTPLLLTLLCCYIGAAVISACWAEVPEKSWTAVLGLLRYIPLGMYACYVLCNRNRLSTLYLGIAAVIAVWVLDAWMQMLTGWSMRGHAEAERISGLFGATDLKLGPTLAVLSPFALWEARQRWGRVGLFITALLVLGPIMLSGSRAAWICFALVVLAFVWRETHSPSRFAITCMMGALILLIAGGIAWKTSTRFDARMQRTLEAFKGNEQDLNLALSGRLDIWHNSLRMFAANPLTGVGVRDFRYAYPHYAPANDHFVVAENCGDGAGACHAHQIILEILTETGVVGLLLWVMGGIIAWRAWYRSKQWQRDATFPLTVALVTMLFPLNTHLAFYSAWWGLLFAWLLGLWCAALYVAQEESTNGA